MSIVQVVQNTIAAPKTFRILLHLSAVGVINQENLVVGVIGLAEEAFEAGPKEFHAAASGYDHSDLRMIENLVPHLPPSQRTTWFDSRGNPVTFQIVADGTLGSGVGLKDALGIRSFGTELGPPMIKNARNMENFLGALNQAQD